MKLNVSDLIEKKLVKKKTYTEGRYKGLSVLKYTGKVFYDNLWHLDERLLECRGTVIDEHWNVIVLPFKKIFNLGENNTTVDPNLKVICPRKVNGYMLSVTYTEEYGFIVSTTGSLDSDYVDMGEQWLNTLNVDPLKEEGVTHLFEVCDERDPHVVSEVSGMYLIGKRCHNTGQLYSEESLDTLAIALNCERPSVWEGLFKDLPLDVEHEGFMVRDFNNSESLCKIKSKHYLSKKALQRCGKYKAKLIFRDTENFRKQLDEEFYDILQKIIDTFTEDEYLNLDEQQRRQWIEGQF